MAAAFHHYARRHHKSEFKTATPGHRRRQELPLRAFHQPVFVFRVVGHGYAVVQPAQQRDHGDQNKYPQKRIAHQFAPNALARVV